MERGPQETTKLVRGGPLITIILSNRNIYPMMCWQVPKEIGCGMVAIIAPTLQLIGTTLYFIYKDVFVHLWKNGLWTWLHFCEGSSGSLLSNTVYIIYYPSSQYIFMSSIKVAYKQYVLQVNNTNNSCSCFRSSLGVCSHVPSCSCIMVFFLL